MEHFYKPRTGQPSTVAGMGERLLSLACSLQLTIVLNLNTKDLSALRLVSRSFQQLAKRYTDTVQFREMKQNKLSADWKRSIHSPSILSVEHVGSLSRGRAVRKEMGMVLHPVLLSGDNVD
ncbi:hypothetical protein MMC27_001928 [Xylographa pallens]|nr:hypothetical protein [Xylographa pallens]